MFLGVPREVKGYICAKTVQGVYTALFISAATFLRTTEMSFIGEWITVLHSDNGIFFSTKKK